MRTGSTVKSHLRRRWRWLIPIPASIAKVFLTPLIALAAAGTVTLIIPPSPPPSASPPQGSFLVFNESVGVTPNASGPDVLNCGFTGTAAPGAASTEQAVIEPGNGISMSSLGTQTIGGVTNYGVLAFTVPVGFAGPGKFAVEVTPPMPGDLAFRCQQVSGPDTLATTGSADTLTVTATANSSSSSTTTSASSTTSSASTTSSFSTASTTSSSGTSTATSTSSVSTSSSSSTSSRLSSSTTSSLSTTTATSTSAFTTPFAAPTATVTTALRAAASISAPARGTAQVPATLSSGVPAQLPTRAPLTAAVAPAPSGTGQYILPRAFPNTGAGGLALP